MSALFAGNKRTRLVAFVGIDGAGKTTQIARLATWVQAIGYPVTVCHNQSLLALRSVLDSIAERSGYHDHVELLGADVARLVSASVKFVTWSNLTRPLTDEGRFVLVDRYVPSQLAAVRNQGGHNEWLIRQMYECLPTPDVTFFLDASPEEAHRRILARGRDAESIPFLTGLRTAYLSLPEAASFVHIDASGSEETVEAAVRKRLLDVIPELAAGTNTTIR